MRILYAIQGTGNGHLSRAKDVIPALKKRVEVDLLLSGQQVEVEFPFEIKYRLKGLSFIFGKKGGIDFWATFKNNKTGRVLREIFSLPIEQYDLVINDFEPISAWAAKIKGVPCISLSHQCSLLLPNSPKPSNANKFESWFLKYYSPSTLKFGFHFDNYSSNIFKPIIRNEIRLLLPSHENHYTVYLPAFSDEKLIKIFSLFPKENWHIFSKHTRISYSVDNVKIEPINGKKFSESMASSAGILCGAGFETPAEAMFLGKKLLVVPMKNQFEQLYNAAALAEMGVTVMPKFKKKNYEIIERWISEGEVIDVFYPDQTQEIIDFVLESTFKTQFSQDILTKTEVKVV